MDKITLKAIEKYFDFKRCDLWSEMAFELDQMNVIPIAPDQSCLEYSRTVLRNKEGSLKSVMDELQKRLKTVCIIHLRGQK
jgi:hypothetical protein